MAGDAIVADGLSKRYGEVRALRGVSLGVRPGEVFALVGPNGAGKSTLVRCLTGTTSPSTGSAALFGSPPDEADRGRIGLLPQAFSPPARLTARELLGYFAGLYDVARPVADVLDAVGMAGSADMRYSSLSGGQKRRTLVGTAIVNDPDALFMDEPTTGIDPAGRRAVWELIEGLAVAGTTVFLTSHDMAEVDRLADRIGVIVDGRLEAVGTPDELVTEHGGASRVVVETATEDGPSAAPERTAVIDRLDAVLDGYSVIETDDGFRIDGVDRDDLRDVVDGLAKADVPYDRFTWEEPDLETVYLELADTSSIGAPDDHRRPDRGQGG